jgi:hypothetical protein
LRGPDTSFVEIRFVCRRWGESSGVSCQQVKFATP